ncbi:MAG: AMP-binding protein [Gammaproteobacteria bacterium]|nr:AMP-binding protein [Gammaproteobacteria bacterium]
MEIFGANLTDLVARRAIYSPNRTAFVDFRKDKRCEYSFKDFDLRASKLASSLFDAGVSPGDRVAILADNGIEQLECCFASWKVGAIHVPLNWRSSVNELQYFLQITTPKTIVVQERFKDLLDKAAGPVRGSHKMQVITIGESGGCEYYSIITGSRERASFSPPADTHPRDTAVILFTGGTTGRPKAVCISHENIAWNTLNTAIHDIKEDDRFLNVLPLFHTGGLLVYTVPLFILGGTTVLLRNFDAGVTLKKLEEEKITVFLSVPTIYRLLSECADWEAAELDNLRFCTSGGAALPLDLIRRYEQEKGICFKQGFGMTEFGPGVFALSPQDAQRKAGSIGRPNFFVQSRIDNEGQEHRENQEGELFLKGPSCCSGYFTPGGQKLEAVDEDGWFHTGDIARHDKEGFYYIVGRKKDMFISGGENVYPYEIEEVALSYEGVRYCAVVGLPDNQWGEAGHLALVPEEHTENFDIDGMLNYLRQRLARYKIPKQVYILPELPMTAAGKVLKEELRLQLEMMRANADYQDH